jgi:tRNA(His) 5'-end guanylyltransferase
MATYYFNDEFRRLVHKEAFDESQSLVTEAHQKAITQKLCVFDSRIFLVPREEVVNYLYFRQLDCVRNSIQSAGQANFSHKALQNKNCNQIQEMLFQEKNINWARDYPAWFRNGIACYKKPTNIITPNGETVERNKWFIDKDIPMFAAQPDFVNKHITFEKSKL